MRRLFIILVVLSLLTQSLVLADNMSSNESSEDSNGTSSESVAPSVPIEDNTTITFPEVDEPKECRISRQCPKNSKCVLDKNNVSSTGKICKKTSGTVYAAPSLSSEKLSLVWIVIGLIVVGGAVFWLLKKRKIKGKKKK